MLYEFEFFIQYINIDNYTNWLILAKRLTKKEKEEIVESFTIGISVDKLSKDFECSKLTITRNLKKNIGEKKYREIINKSKSYDKYFLKEEKNVSLETNNNQNKNNLDDVSLGNKKYELPEKDFFSQNPFLEIVPLECDIENEIQKDLSSVHISEVKFPKIVYMIVDNKIELETKYLREYPEWQFLSQEELDRKTIEIYLDMKLAKRFCRSSQKIIKVPNTEVFKIVAPILIDRGITRIVSRDKLIAL